MPAKRKVTREAMIKAAFRLLRNGGEEAVNGLPPGVRDFLWGGRGLGG